ncbi:SAV_2336 N-terminal domain-related protein [Streptomyces sp. NPDC059373]
MPGRLLRVLEDSGAELSAGELLDALWLARDLPSGAAAPVARALGGVAPAAPADTPPEPPAPREPPEPPRPAPPAGRPLAPTPRRSRTVRRPGALHASADPPAARRRTQPNGEGPPERSARPVRVPEEKALGTDELRLGRSLRPLKQRYQTGRSWELDDDATAEAMADTGLPEVIMRPTRERWLDLALVVDDGLSMLLWRRLATELRALAERLGAFRNLRMYGLDSRAGRGPLLRVRPYDPASPVLSTAAVCDPSGHTLVLVVSDGVGTAWRDGRMRGVLERWARHGPTAVVHALPARMWRSSGIRAETWQVTTRRRGAANESWHVADPVLPPGVADFSGVPVPVLEPHPVTIARWANLVASPGGSAVLPLAAWDSPTEPRPVGGLADPVLRFRDTASPQAYRLAAHLAAVAPVSVPVMRLVQAAVPWHADTAHLAEVFLGGLLRRSDADSRSLPPEHQRFDFAERDREILLDVAPPSELARTSHAVTQKLSVLAGRSPDFPAWLAHQRGTDVLPDRSRPFGWLGTRLMAHLGAPPAEPPAGRSPAPDPAAWEEPDLTAPPSTWRSLRADDPRYIGPYKLIERSDVRGTATAYLSLDGEGNEAVVEVAGPRGRDRAREFVENEVTALSRMAGRYAPSLIASGPGDRLPWLAMELVTTDAQIPAPTLRALGQKHGSLAASDWFLRIAWHLSRGLTILGANGIVHGALTPETVLVTEHTVRITHWMTARIDGSSPRGSESTPFASDAAYRAPEIRYPDDLGPETDVYSLGAILIAASTGQISHRLFRQSLLPSLAVSAYPPVIRAMLAGCVDDAPAARPAAAEVTAAIESCLPGPPPEDPEQDPATARTDAPAGRLITLRRDARRRAPQGEYERLVRAIRTPVNGNRRISVASHTKGLGSSTISAVLGAVLAEQRGDRVLAIDVDSHPGSRVALSRRFYQNAPFQLRDTTWRLPTVTDYDSLRGFLVEDASGLTVVTNGAMARSGNAWRDRYDSVRSYQEILGWVAPHFPVLLTDEADESGSLSRPQFGHTDSLVIVTAEDTMSLGRTKDLLEGLEVTHPQLVREAVLVVNKGRSTPGEATVQSVNRLSERCRGVIVMPYDGHLASTGVLLLDWLADETYEMGLRLAALVAEGFATPAAGSGRPEA